MLEIDVHPSRAELESFALGLDDPSCDTVEEHLAACTVCQHLVAGIPYDGFVSLLRSVGPDEGDSTLAEAVQTDEIGLPQTGPLESAEAVVATALPATLAGHPRYVPIRLLGSGGMGDVWLAEHRVMRRQVAVKVIRPELLRKPEVARRFHREAQAVARLSHPNIVAAFDAEQAGDAHLLAMEYVEGVSLAEHLARRGPLPMKTACDYVRQAALGLQHAFERGLVHRDIKPGNLILTASPVASAPGVIKILDFGLAVLADVPREPAAKLTAPHVILGTADYIAPEQAKSTRQADIRADVYGLGCTLYHLLSGKVPHPGGTALDKVIRHSTEDPRPLDQLRPELPPDLVRVVERMMAKDPADRYQTPAEVAIALQPFIAPKARPRQRWAILVAAAAVLFGLLLGAVVVHRIQTDKGELVITTESDDVEVIVKQGGKVVHVIDAKTGKQIALTLNSGVYELELKGAPEGLKLDIDRVTLTRGETRLAKIEWVRKDGPEVAKVGEIRRFGDPSYRIAAVAFSPDGRFILTGSFRDVDRHDNDLHLWDAATGKELRRFRGRGAVMSVAFSPDGKRIVSGSAAVDHPWAPGEVIIWDVETANPLHRVPSPVGFFPSGVAWGRGGKHVFACDWAGGLVLQLDAETGKPVQEFKGHDGTVRCLAVSPNGRYLVTGACVRVSKDTSIRLWDIDTGKEIRRFGEYVPDGHGSVAFSPDSRHVVSSGKGGLRLWDVSTGKEIRRFEGGGDVAYSPDGRRILSAGADVRLWDAETGKELCRFTSTKAFSSVTFSPDGRMALAAGPDNGAILYRLPDPPAAAKIEPVPGGPAAPGGEAIDVVHRKELPGKPQRAFVSADGRYFLACFGEPSFQTIVWEVETGKEAYKLPASWAQFTPDSKHVVSVADGSEIVFSDIDTGKKSRSFRTEDGWVSAFYFSPGGRYLGLSLRDGGVTIWDVARGKRIMRMDGTGGFLPDGKRLWYTRSGEEGRGKCYDLESGKVAVGYEAMAPYAGFSVQRSGRYAYTNQVHAGMRTFWLVETATGRKVHSWTPGEWGEVLAFPTVATPWVDDTHSLASLADGTIRLFDVFTHKERARFQLPGRLVGHDMDASPDGRFACVVTDGSVYLLRLPKLPRGEKP